MLDIGQSSGRFDKNRDENLTFGARPRIANLYDKQSNAISRNKDNCFGNISLLERKPIRARYASEMKKQIIVARMNRDIESPRRCHDQVTGEEKP